MNLNVTEEAANWYKEELELNDETSIRFFVRYGGVGGLQPGLSLAIKEEDSSEPIAKDKVNQITFFIEADDEWYFDGHSLTVQYDEKRQEPEFIYE
ncbi:HesB/YadR/YfhF family protein [Halobacillus sp. B23F22_1]|uniref:HesB/YadR/YfhF family protein n=1 Tax=Halobacillus sp. B23F22_1 TaxID=3459514 RepID=UPI00373E2BB5